MTARKGRSNAIGDDDAGSSVGHRLVDLAGRVDAIADAVKDRSALEAQLTLTLSELVQLREIRVEVLQSRVELLAREEEIARNRQTIESFELSLNDLSQSLASLSDARDALDDELKKVKRKYRRTITDAQAAKNEAASLRLQLASAQSALGLNGGSPISSLLKRLGLGGIAVAPGSRRATRARRAHQIELVRQSHLFDADWYLAAYPDVAEAKLDPAVHFATDGWSEGRDPGPEFNTSSYLKANSDVAQLGLNPLVHYLEHGLAEGRSPGAGSSAITRRSVEDFGPPAAVFCLPIVLPVPVRWTRHYQLDTSRRHFTIGDVCCGYDPDGMVPIAAAVGRFWRISGLAGDPPLAAQTGETKAVRHPEMRDGWFAGQNLFKARWWLDGDGPIVIRACQRDRDGEVRLIGEALVTNALDIVDFPAAHPLFPILFVACDEDGLIVGACNLSFPSLCRGGLHYAELLSHEASASPVELSERHGEALENILAERTVPLLKAVRIDLAGADGTRPMFQSDCQHWLDCVLRIDLADALAPSSIDCSATRFLSDRASGVPGNHAVRNSGLAELIVPSDSIPTIAALVAVAQGELVDAAATAVSMIVVHADPAKTALAVMVPGALAPAAGDSGAESPRAFPLLVGAVPAQLEIPAAIRTLAERGLAESELLQPLAQPLAILPAVSREQKAVVAIEPALWSLPALEGGLAALRLQAGADLITVCLIGNVDAQRQAMVEGAFAGRTSNQPDAQSYVQALDDVNVLHLGPGVILHDNRTLQAFQALLERASSASCPVLTCTKRGKTWAVCVADAGQVVGNDGERTPVDFRRHAELLWRSTVPVWRQPVHLWAARSDVLRNAPLEAGAPHLLCGRITASYWGEKPAEQPTITLPSARAELSLRVAELVG